jgi:ketosteroid isomerase-like protein
MAATRWRRGSATTGEAREAGVEIDTEMYHQVITFRDGRMVRIEYFTEWAAALQAAGLRK